MAVRLAQTCRIGRPASAVALLLGAAVPTYAQDAAPVTSASATQSPPVAETGPAAPIHAGGATITANGNHSYPSAYFQTFAPRTALDMVEKVPGFTIQQNNNGGGRGLGAARDNVLINGERIAAKSTSAQDALSRIASGAVERIDIVDGATLNIPGLTGQVANVIVRDTGLTTTFSWDFQPRQRMDVYPWAGTVSTSGKIGRNSVSVSLSNDGFRRGHWGPERVFDASGALQFTRDELVTYDLDEPKLTASFGRKADNGNQLNLNSRIEVGQFIQRQTSTSVQPVFGAVSEPSYSKDTWRVGEVGGDYDFALGGGRLKLITLHTLSHSPDTLSRYRFTSASGRDVGEQFREDIRSHESILRGEYGWKSGATEWQLALEGAYNALSVDADYATLQPDGTYKSIAFDGSQTDVHEWRSDASLTYTRPLSPRLSLQATLGGEYSALTLAGVNGRTRQFVRPKGRAVLTWRPSQKTSVAFEIQHRIEQLDFGDFASSVDVSEGTGNATNGDLVPPQLSRAFVEVTHDMGRWGNITIGTGMARIMDPVDQIPLSPTSEGRGNIDTAIVGRISGKLTLLLDPIGWTGARLNVDLMVRDNRVRDPLLGDYRRISGSDLRNIEMSFRHDVPRTSWAWGWHIERYLNAPQVRLNQVSTEYRDRPTANIYVEHKALLGMTARLSLANLFNVREIYWRDAYVGRRDTALRFHEDRARRFGRYLNLTLSGKI